MPILPTRSEPPEIVSNNVLLIEGNDEINFFNSLLLHMNIMPNAEVQTRSVQGKDNFQDELTAFLNDPHFSHVTAYAIIRDADTNVEDALTSVRNLLIDSHQPCPNTHSSFAFNYDRSLKVGIFVISNGTSGMLEDVCLQSVANHPIMPYVNDYIARVNDTMGSLAPKNQSKARAQAFLAGMHKNVPSLGVGALKKYWNFDSEVFNDLRSFIGQLILPSNFQDSENT